MSLPGKSSRQAQFFHSVSQLNKEAHHAAASAATIAPSAGPSNPRPRHRDSANDVLDDIAPVDRSLQPRAQQPYPTHWGRNTSTAGLSASTPALGGQQPGGRKGDKHRSDRGRTHGSKSTSGQPSPAMGMSPTTMNPAGSFAPAAAAAGPADGVPLRPTFDDRGDPRQSTTANPNVNPGNNRGDAHLRPHGSMSVSAVGPSPSAAISREGRDSRVGLAASSRTAAPMPTTTATMPGPLRATSARTVCTARGAKFLGSVRPSDGGLWPRSAPRDNSSFPRDLRGDRIDHGGDRGDRGSEDWNEFDREGQHRGEYHGAGYHVGSSVNDLTDAQLIDYATSLSCRNFFRARVMRLSSSDSSSDGESFNGSTSSQTSRTSQDTDDTGQSRPSQASTALADGQPRSAKQISALVKDGKVIPVHFRVGASTVALSTTIATYGSQAAITARPHDASGAQDRTALQDLDAAPDPVLTLAALAGRRDGEGEASIVDRVVSAVVLRLSNPRQRLREYVMRRARAQREECYARLLVPKAWAEHDLDAFHLDDPQIIGKRRRKVVSSMSYLSSIITYADHRASAEDVDQRFFLTHPSCEARGLGLSSIRKVKALLLGFAMGHSSPIDVATATCAVCYFERLVLDEVVNATNKRLIAATCAFLAAKFYETGVTKKQVMDRKLRWVLERCDDAFGIDQDRVLAAEFKVYAALGFDLLLPTQFALAHFVRLLGEILNLTPSEHFMTRRGATLLQEAEDDSGSD